MSPIEPAAEHGRLLNVSLSARGAWLSAAAGAAINAIGMPMSMKIGMAVPGMPLWPPLGSALWGVAILLALWIFRRQPSLRVASGLYLLNTLAVVGALFVTDRVFALAGQRWVPFQANKLGCLVAALIAPTGILGMVGILAHAGSSLLNFALLPEAIRQRLGGGEPMATLAFGVCGLLALFFRLRRILVEVEIARAQAELAALRRFAATVRQLKDLINTPLQTIELGVTLLAGGKVRVEPVFESMDRALGRLRRINDALTRYEESFDARREGEDLQSLVKGPGDDEQGATLPT